MANIINALLGKVRAKNLFSDARDVLAYVGIQLLIVAGILFILRNKFNFIYSKMFPAIFFMGTVLFFWFVVQRHSPLLQNEPIKWVVMHLCVIVLMYFFVIAHPAGVRVVLSGFLLLLCLFLFYKFSNFEAEGLV